MAGFEATKVNVVIDDLNKPSIIALDVRPNEGSGVAAAIGSLALVNNGVDPAERWQKITASDTGWQQIVDTTSAQASATIGHIDNGETSLTVTYLYDPDDVDSVNLLQDAADALEANGGGYIFIKSGTYSFATTTFTGDYTLRGEGVGNTIIDSSRDDGNLIFDGAANVSDIQLGTESDKVDVPLNFTGGGNVIVKNVYVYNLTDGILIDKDSGGGDFVDFENVYVDGGSIGISIVQAGSANTGYSISFRQCRILATSEGLAVAGGYRRFSADGCTFSVTGVDVARAVMINGNLSSSSTVFSGCVFDIETSATLSSGVIYLFDETTAIHNVSFDQCSFNVAGANICTIQASINNFAWTANNVVAGANVFHYPEAASPASPTIVSFLSLGGYVGSISGNLVNFLDQQLALNGFTIRGLSTAATLLVRVTGLTLAGFNILDNATIRVDISATHAGGIISGNTIAATGTNHSLRVLSGTSGTNGVIVSRNNINTTSSQPAIYIDALPASPSSIPFGVLIEGNYLFATTPSRRVYVRALSPRLSNNSIFRVPSTDGTYDFELGDDTEGAVLAFNRAYPFNSTDDVNIYFLDLGTGAIDTRAIYNDLGGAVPGVLDTALDASVVFGETTPNEWPGTNWNEGTYDAGGGGS